MTSVAPLTILIIGNGVAGPILAMALQKTTPHKIVLVDSGPEEALPIGAALGIAPNGLCALRFIGAEHIVLERGGRQEYMAARRGDTGVTITEQPTADLFVKKFGFAVSISIASICDFDHNLHKGYGIVRQEYCAALRALAKERGIDMRFNMRLQSIEEKNGVVSAHFNDGETLNGDLLVGCDGIHSPTRAYVVGSDTKPDFANASVVIGLSKVRKEDEEAAKLTRGANLFLGTEANFGLLPADSDGTWVW
jgi:2-polyprenyl-6-methoxyphenol hydroxylase-like FAD-dependent oxidoreductase